MPTVVVLDANALLLPFERNLSIEGELERLFGTFQAIVPESVLRELATMAALSKGRRKANAQMALTLATRFEYAGTQGKGDAGVLEVARRLEAVLFTNDREVRQEARRHGLRTVFLRGFSHLETDPD